MASSVNLLAAFLLLYGPTSCHAHGRMLSPCGRASCYLAGLGTPVNYNDHEMNCGGRVVQWDQNDGKCGICGDPYPGEHPYERPNGYMVQHNVISETYLENQVFKLGIQITVAHYGYHEFRIVNVADCGGVEATQKCLDRTLLADENGQTRFTKGTTEPGYFEYTLVLPEGLTCKQCVIQWKWKCGNDWGCFKDGTCCKGCGDRQEEFYGCADVTINPRDFRQNVTTQKTSSLTSSSTTPTTSFTSTTTTTTTTSTTTASTTTTTPTTPPSTTPVFLSILSSLKSSPTTTATTSTQKTTTTPTTVTTTPTTVTTTPTTVTTTPTTPRPTTSTTQLLTRVPVKVPGNSFQQNRINQFPGLRNMSNENSIEYHSINSNTKKGIIVYKTKEDFVNMVMGYKTNVSSRVGSIPTPDPSQTIRESEEKKMQDRICGMCATKMCNLNICKTTCVDVPPCTTSP